MILSEGFLLGFTIIVGFGPQNSFIVQQGMKCQYVLMMVLIASVIDFLLIGLSTGGASQLLTGSPVLIQFTTWLGAGFLVAYGAKSFVSVFNPQVVALQHAAPKRMSRGEVLLAIVAVSLLNPGTYLDTLLIIGGGAAHYTKDVRGYFAFGACMASFSWFFMLAFGATKFSQMLKNITVIRCIDAASAVFMWFIAFKLVTRVLM